MMPLRLACNQQNAIAIGSLAYSHAYDRYNIGSYAGYSTGSYGNYTISIGSMAGYNNRMSNSVHLLSSW